MINYNELDKMIESLENKDNQNTVVVNEASGDNIGLVILGIMILISYVYGKIAASKRREYYVENILKNQKLIDLLNRLCKVMNKDIADRLGSKFGKYVVNPEIEGGSIYWNGFSARDNDPNNIIYFIAGNLDGKKLFKDMCSNKDYSSMIYDTSASTTKKIQSVIDVINQFNTAVGLENKVISSKTGLTNSIYVASMNDLYENISMEDYLRACDPDNTEAEIFYICYIRLMDYTKLAKLPAELKARLVSGLQNIHEDAELNEVVEMFIKGE